LEFTELVRLLSNPQCEIEVRCEQVWPEGAGSSKQPDLLVLARDENACALLLIENKVYASESGIQYPRYRDALARLGGTTNRPTAYRAFLLSPDAREKPDGWSGTLLHAQLADILEPVSRNSAIPTWDRAACYMVADAFRHADGLSMRVAELRELRARLRRTGTPSSGDLVRARELLSLSLPKPLRWRIE
jgi:hypothetical protein